MESNSELKAIFANVNEWLKFAEAKHGGLMALNIAIVIGVGSCYSSIHTIIFKPAAVLAIVLFGLSVFVSLVSQFPVTQNLFYNRETIENPNLYFFGHLAHIDSAAFNAEMHKIDSTYTQGKFDEFVVNQILVNARIALSKYQFFKAACWATIVGIGILGLSTILKIIWHY